MGTKLRVRNPLKTRAIELVLEHERAGFTVRDLYDKSPDGANAAEWQRLVDDAICGAYTRGFIETRGGERRDGFVVWYKKGI